MLKSLVVVASGIMGASYLAGGVSLTALPNTGFSFDPANINPGPAWSAGALVTVDAYGSPIPVVTARDVQGALVSSVSIAIPGAKATGILSAVRRADGSVVACGWTSDAEGRTASILAIISSDGGTLNVTRTGPFAPRRVAIDADGSIWAQGAQGRTVSAIPDPDPSHGVIRHFDGAGKLLGSFVPEASLDSGLRTSEGYLAVSAGIVGWISQVRSKDAVSGLYVEILADGSVHQYSLPTMAFLRGFGITDAGIPVADIVLQRGHGEGSPEQSAIMSLNRVQTAWSATAIPGMPSAQGAVLLGAGAGALAIWDVNAGLVRFFSAK